MATDDVREGGVKQVSLTVIELRLQRVENYVADRYNLVRDLTGLHQE